jgi:starvation-inducible DNA-binding protein
MEEKVKIANTLVAYLKAIYTIHQQNHWLSKGDHFYDNHLLFQRLYESAQEDLDSIAEKCIGIFGEDSVDYNFQLKITQKIMTKYVSQKGLKQSLSAEKDYLKILKTSYLFLKEKESMTLGLDDMIMSIYSKREESVYLLQQALGIENE